MRGPTPVRIDADRDLFRLDSREQVAALGDVDDDGLGYVLRERHREQWRVATVIESVFEIGDGHAEHLGDPGEEHRRSVSSATASRSTVTTFELRLSASTTSLAVEDPSAHRSDRHDALAVLLCGDGERRRRHHLEEPEAGEEGGEETDRDDPENTHPQMGGVTRHAVPAEAALPRGWVAPPNGIRRFCLADGPGA